MIDIANEKYVSIAQKDEPTILTGIPEFDRWFSHKGGMVVGSSIFLTGTSGAGKTTLVSFLANVLKNHSYSLYTREMSRAALKEQVDRLGIQSQNFYVSDKDTKATYQEYRAFLDILKPKIVVLDSAQVIAMEDFSDKSETDAIVYMVQDLRKWAEDNDAVLFVIGHVTKEGAFRGDNTIMQLFDAHMEMIHHKNGDYRTIAWGQKNRKGPLGMLYYEFTDNGIKFYTKGQWDAKGKNISVSCHVLDSILGYLDTINTSHVNYVPFKKELDENLKKVFSEYSDELQLTMEILKISQSLLTKYNLNK